MTTFAVAWASLYDNEMHLEFIEAEDARAAMLQSKAFSGCSAADMEEYDTVEALSASAFDMDTLVGAKELPGSGA